MTYQYHTQPFKHQAEIFAETSDREGYALFWEQGCGKTKPTIDTACSMFEAGRIDALVIVAPNGVHRNWLTDEIPAHMPPRVREKMTTFLWESSKSGNKGFKQDLESLLTVGGLAVLAISYDAFVTKTAVNYLGRFFRRRKVLFVADEGHYLKTPGTARSRTVRTAAKYAKARRLLTGTPVSQGPFDVYAQVQFVDPTFWKSEGIPDYSTFKHTFGVWLPREQVKSRMGFDPGFDGLCVEYKNLELLESMIKKIGHRLTKDDAGLNLPPKLYSKRYFDLTSQQRTLYDELKRNFVASLESGEVIEAPLVIVQMLRLHQITCGYVATGDENEIVEIPGSNPRLNAAEDIRDTLHHPAIFWSRFTRDIDKLMDLLGKRAVRYDGRVDDDARAQAKADFQSGAAQFFVGNPQAGSTGLTLIQARSVIYYSNSFRLIDRLQSEDRAHRIGQEHPVNYIDIVAHDTIDAHIVTALREKFDVASKITGDKVKEWL